MSYRPKKCDLAWSSQLSGAERSPAADLVETLGWPFMSAETQQGRCALVYFKGRLHS